MTPTDTERGPNLRMDVTDAEPSQRWKTCQKGSCHRHQECMYTPCWRFNPGAHRPAEQIAPSISGIPDPKDARLLARARRIQSFLLARGHKLSDADALGAAAAAEGS